ncbi:MAG: hypothetical protein AB1Z66_01800 [Candidatus Limnocylindrales bacterium]
MRDRSRQKGQAIALLAIALAAIVAGVAVVVDGGYAYAQRRVSQNASDFSAMAGTRVIGLKRIGQPVNGAQVRSAIDSALSANDATLVSATYIDQDGVDLGPVSTGGAIPGNAFGVVVEATTSWQPFLLGLLGVTDWNAGSRATAKTPGEALGGGVMPVGIEDLTYNELEACPLDNLNPCIDQNLTSGELNIPGGFGWLKFGLQGNGGKCDWSYSLGMIADGGCQTSKTFLDSQIGPPADSHGCCTAVDEPGPNGETNENKIGSLTGNEWGDLSFYIDNRIPVWVPIWDDDITSPGGANGYYGIVGFGAIVFTGDNEHAKWLEGAAIADACEEDTEIEGELYCSAPGGPFILDATGEVELIN